MAGLMQRAFRVVATVVVPLVPGLLVMGIAGCAVWATRATSVLDWCGPISLALCGQMLFGAMLFRSEAFRSSWMDRCWYAIHGVVEKVLSWRL